VAPISRKAAPYERRRSVTIASGDPYRRIQRRLSVAALCHKGLQHFAFVIDRTPEVMHLAIDLDEHLVEVPLSLL
jgi:hypothetical protein